MADYTMLLDIDHVSMQKLFGTNDAYIRKVEDEFGVSVINRDGMVKITGEKTNVKKVYRLLQELLEISTKGIVIGTLLLAGIGGLAIFWFAVRKKTFSDLIAAAKEIGKKKQ